MYRVPRCLHSITGDRLTVSSNKPKDEQTQKVPQSRFARLSRMGALATGIAGGMVAEGVRQLAKGNRPKVSQMLLTPANAKRLADQLSRLRGAAMKLGQLLSMDAGDIIPAELAEILARLRSSARAMPNSQLGEVLRSNWGEQWEQQFAFFNFKPIAAASIGQVHEAFTRDGQRLAIKIQYPGVRESIDSDIDNVASLFRLSGVVPKDIDLKPLLEQAKAQLHEEADYLREAESLKHYRSLLNDSQHFLMPEVYEQWCTKNILVMSHVQGVPVESLTGHSQALRDKVASLAFKLFFRELFEFRFMQTDPNFANFQFCTQTERLILLDFGASRRLPVFMVEQYGCIVDAALAGDRAGLDAAARAIGYYDNSTLVRHRDLVLDMIELACEPLCTQGEFDFGQTDLAQRIREKGMDLGMDRDFWHVPPVDALFLQRKVGGVFLLASRLKARVNIQAQLPELFKR